MPSLPLPIDAGWIWVYRGLVLCALVLLLAAQWAFYRGKTTIYAGNPAATTTLLSRGVFGLSRNPVYLAMLLMIVAIAWRQGQATGLLGAVVFIVWITRWQILPEERALTERFGDEYGAYCARVRRWL